MSNSWRALARKAEEKIRGLSDQDSIPILNVRARRLITTRSDQFLISNVLALVSSSHLPLSDAVIQSSHSGMRQLMGRSRVSIVRQFRVARIYFRHSRPIRASRFSSADNAPRKGRL